MSSMEDLVEFFRARLDEDERWALAASPGPWSENAESTEVLAVDGVTVADGFALSGNQLRATVAHIVRHDPDRVLREVETDRQLLAAYEAAVRRKKASWRNYSAWINGDPEPYSVLPDGPDEKAIPGLEIAIRIRAVRFDRDADYREEWKP